MQLVSYEIDDAVATVSIDRPDKLNALNTEVLRELEEAFQRLEGEVRSIVLRSAGDRAFVAGADLAEFDEYETQTEFRAFLRRQNRVNDYVADHPALVVSAVDGLAFGGGFELVLATDLVVAEADAEFGFPEVSRGFVPGGGGTQRLPRIVGPTKAKEMITTGTPVSAEEARQLGLVNRVVEDGEGEDAARGLLAETMANAPLAVEAATRLVDEGMDASLDTAMGYEQAVAAFLYTTEDTEEGLEAFREKREPDFSGD